MYGLNARFLSRFRPFIEEPVDVDDVSQKQKSSRPLTALFLLLLGLLGISTAIYQCVVFQTPTAYASNVLWDVTTLLVLVGRPRTGSFVLVALFAGIVVSHAVSIFRLSAYGWNHDLTWDIAGAALATIAVVIVVNMPLRDPSLSRAQISQPFTLPEKDLRSPEDNLTFWQWMSVTWMAPLIAIGNKRQLNDGDVWQLPFEFQHTHLHNAFRLVTGTVVWRLIKANWIDLVLLTFLCILELTGTLAGPIMLQQLLQAMELLAVNRRPAIIWATSMVAVRLVAAQSGIFSLWFGRRCYERSRGEMITMLHEKVLNRKLIGMTPEEIKEKLDAEPSADDEHQDNDGDEAHAAAETNGLISGKTKTKKGFFAQAVSRIGACFPSTRKRKVPDVKKPASMGKILNLMRNDVYEVAQRFWDYQDIIQKPLGLIFSIILIWRLLGWSCLVGIAILLVAQAVNAVLARVLVSWETTRRKTTDQKLQQVSQYIEAIRHLRWYGWHVKMLESVMSARQKELNIRIITFAIQNAIMFVNTLAAAILPVAAFWAYTSLAGNQLRIDIAFPALQIFKLLQASLRDVPGLITVLINAAIAVGRIEDFMSEPDLSQNKITEYGDRLEVKNASFSWPGTSQKTLRDITLSFRSGLNLIIGPVASGKSALLQALLGEMDIQDGDLIKPNAAIAYCAQTPWLQSMTIRENILFDGPYEEMRYKQTLEVCALLPDLASFERGDLSPIGENGIGLSGGQKARVALARAVYSRAKFLLLDDPISALDHQTAEWIVSRCFNGDFLKDRTVVLVTHRTDLCQEMPCQIVEMSDGAATARDHMPKNSDALVAGEQSNGAVQRAAGASIQTQEAQESAAIPEKFEEEEHRADGGVQFKVYWEYIKAGKLKLWALLFLSTVLWRLLEYSQTWFLKTWGEAYRTSGQSSVRFLHLITFDRARSFGNHHFMSHTSFANEDGHHEFLDIASSWSSKIAAPFNKYLDDLPDPNVNINPWLLTLLIIVLIQNLTFVVSQTVMLFVTYTSGKRMFSSIMKSISNATFHFYDVTPVGRLMNRITGDVGTVDGPISMAFLHVAWFGVSWVLSVLVIATVTPLFLILSISLSAIFVYVFLRFLPTSQSLRRLEMVSLSPLMSNFGALLHGLTTVRAFNAQTQFQARVISVTDAFQKMDHFYWSLQAWLMYRFDTLSALATYILTIFAIFSGLTPGLTAFVLTATNSFITATHSLCKLYGKLQLDFVSVERVVELLHLEQEEPGQIVPPATWPRAQGGDIVFENVTLRYAPHLPPALKDVSLTIPGAKSTAIVGRTGSGKSTLALSLLATITPESGRILIDGVDISKVSKQILRERITFLAQDPVLFPGTLRTNLDPLQYHSDTECSDVLARIGGEKYGWTLTTAVDTGGKNLSQGQRQLVGLARAILRRSSIVILDEATASIDFETSKEVQRVMINELGEGRSTIVGIAHRASAVEGCDYIVKLKAGLVEDSGERSAVEADVEADDEAT